MAEMSELLPRVRLAALPTPVEFLPRLSTGLGPRIFVKRDDLTGLAGGGNKTRKLEYLAADARDKGADTLVTVGAAQSNHCRQTAAAAACLGMKCVLVLRGEPAVEETGNLLLDRLLGAELRWSGARERETVMEEVCRQLSAAGRKPYPIPLGGSTPLGAAAYVNAMVELSNQSVPRFDRILFASSSGGTHAGLAVGASMTGFTGEVLGISIDEPLSALTEIVAGIAMGTAVLIGAPHRFRPADIHVNADYLGAGYGVVGELEREAIHLFARSEGILLDPVYTGRAAGALIDLIRRGSIRADETILFWHTGGTPALWAYATVL